MQQEETRTCFICDAPATTNDHIPPKCIFPEFKDVGEDYRNNLITIPACGNHNLRTALDDEYLMGVIAFHWCNNQVAYKQSTTKIKRALQRNKRYFDLFFREGKHKLLSWNGEPLVTAPVDINRFNSIMQKIARGIYFFHFNRKWLGDVSIHPLSLVPVYGGDPGPNAMLLTRVAQQMRSMCDSVPQHGANPEVFYYRIAHDDPPMHTIMHLVFYGGFEVLANLCNNPWDHS